MARRLIVTSGSGRFTTLVFDGKSFKGKEVIYQGTNPSWVLFKAPNLLYANDENGNKTRFLLFDKDADKFWLQTENVGSNGVVHLEFNKDQTRMVGASFGGGSVDIWDTSAENGSIKLMKTVILDDTLTSGQDSAQAHQSALDPTGRYFVVPERGADTLSIIDSKDDLFAVVNKVRVKPEGCGPRHGCFINTLHKSSDGKKATHFVLVCENQNLVQLFSVKYLPDALQFTHVQSLSTFGKDIPPINPTVPVAGKQSAAAGAIAVASNQRDIYVSNRLTGNSKDSIAHLVVNYIEGDATKASLKYSKSINSCGVCPRMFSLSLDEKFLFSTNQNGGAGLVAYARDEASGELTVIEESKTAMEFFRDEGQMGCLFVQEI